MRSPRRKRLASFLALAVAALVQAQGSMGETLRGTLQADQALGTGSPEDRAGPTARKPGLVFLASVLVPGTGQLLNGDRRGYLYLGVEAVAWFTRFSYLDAGNRKEGLYEAFARAHWSYARFHGDAGADGCQWSSRADSLILWFEQNDPQQYYEEIGKLEAYRCGWDDFRGSYDPDDPEHLSPRRQEYRDMRRKSNDLLKKGQLALTVAVLNRIVSGIDAFQTARRRAAPLRLESGIESGPHGPRAELRLVRDLP